MYLHLPSTTWYLRYARRAAINVCIHVSYLLTPNIDRMTEERNSLSRSAEGEEKEDEEKEGFTAKAVNEVDSERD